MRIFPYKCTNGKCCIYTLDFSSERENVSCTRCGMGSMDADTIWDRIRQYYYNTISYDWRLGQIWYRFKCWGWKRYTTVKPRNLPHTWYDRGDLIPHLIFEVLCQFVEKEVRHGYIDWEYTAEHSFAKQEMDELYKWWTEEYDPDYPYSLPLEDLKKIDNTLDIEEEQAILLRNNCKRVIDLIPFMWT